MPKGPKGQKRPADVIANAVLVMKIATGEAEDKTASERRVGGRRGGRARAQALSPEQRVDIARTAAAARWKKAR